MSNSMTEVSSTPYTVLPNSFTYYIYPASATLTSPVFILPAVTLQTSQIVVVNLNAATVTVQTDTLVVKDSIEKGQNGTFLPNLLHFTWQEAGSSATTSTGSSGEPLFPLVPIITSNNQADNNSYWGVTGSSNASGSDFYFPFTTGGQYWSPSSFPGFLIASSPSSAPAILRGALVTFRGATSSNYYTGVTLRGANSTQDVLLYTFNNTETQNPNGIFVTFPNIKSFFTMYILIISAVGTASNLGIAQTQYFGYYPA